MLGYFVQKILSVGNKRYKTDWRENQIRPTEPPSWRLLVLCCALAALLRHPRKFPVPSRRVIVGVAGVLRRG